MKKTIEVRYLVDVEMDESKLTPEFMAEFRRDFYPFSNAVDHAKHIAQLEVRGLLRDFIEGYGPASDFGISARVVDSAIGEA